MSLQDCFLLFNIYNELEWPWVGYPLYGMVKIPKWVVPTPTKMRKMGTTHTKNGYYSFLIDFTIYSSDNNFTNF